MLPIEPLGISANQWQFLSSPDRYVIASNRSGRKLVLESTRRQFLTARDILARINGSYGESAHRGILLADDVGLGKTTVAALVAWVVASAGAKGGVRILAPNDVMVRRWNEELLSHVEPLQKCAPALSVLASRVKARRVGRLSAGSIQVVKHSYASSDLNLACDLLIVDEAHRAKGEGSAFSDALRRQKKYARRVLILTATPFSIHLDELQRMLNLIGGGAASNPVRAYSRVLDSLYAGSVARSPEVVAEKLASTAKSAVAAMGSFVIRHSIEDLPLEQQSFGERTDWNIVVPSAKPNEVELMLRIDRARRIAKDDGAKSSHATNDSRFHVGWRHFDQEVDRMRGELQQLNEPARAVVAQHLKSIKRLRSSVNIHSKMLAVGAAVKSVVDQGEKVILFCDYHATAQELTAYLATVLNDRKAERGLPAASVWRKAWDTVLAPVDDVHHDEKLRKTFIEWLCSDLIRAQTWSWIGRPSAANVNLVELLRKTCCRQHTGSEKISEAARRLYRALLQSRSSRAVLKEAENRLERIPGANGTSRVLGVCTQSGIEKEDLLFIHNAQPDTIISIFNSPFGPDVIVVTDKLSEGIDLHRYCRHLIHYELDPSPIRTVQRNGRLRRVNSWAAVTGKPILYAYPAFRGTRDHKLVQIMKKRIGSFSLLLGGVQEFDIEEVVGSEERWRNNVITIAKASLAVTNVGLRAVEPASLP